ncbi:MAG: hypothetical protein K0M69_13190, partial [Youngiibacter sp.]|nr:hypothetical protein [Youngiibacter sp.]
SINASYASLKASVDASSRTSVEFTQTVTTGFEEKIQKKITDFDQHPTIRLAIYLYQRFEEYTAQVYAYNPATKAYDIKINQINYTKVSGRYLSPSTLPTMEYCWGVAN